MTTTKTGRKTTRRGERRPSRARRHPSIRRRRHVVSPAGAAEIREAAGVTPKDVAAAQRILAALGLDG
jgi:hypothetical protein